ncbi:regulatory protein RecX [Psittacicella hinzii]|uniref:Regulatory protein RecX n=1 Tax=Psittacicella hinzii TaxID=2028575 RepID=A0A3A1YLM8_9GAMM|nr:regulatory protein RecX [Psittacicella hinzii]RIY39193.1 hypothetical protein CKF58_02685 [Psittacicella hinzii]
MAKRLTAYDYLIYLLSKRECSAHQLLQKLREKGYEAQESEQALEICQSKNYQSDKRFAEVFVHDQALSRFGPQNIRQKLRQKGVSNEDIEQALEQAQVNWQHQAFALFIAKDFHNLDLKDPKVKAKVTRGMLSKGYEFAHLQYISQTLKTLQELNISPLEFIVEHDFTLPE